MIPSGHSVAATPSGGYDRIAGAIRNLGHKASDQKVGNMQRDSEEGKAAVKSPGSRGRAVSIPRRASDACFSRRES